MLRPFIPLILYGSVLVVIFLFTQFPPRRAVLFAMIGGSLFLPANGFSGPAGLHITKFSMIALGCLIATFIFEPDRLFTFTPGLLDIPFIVFTIWVLPSQISNGLSPLSPTANHLLAWSVPYFIGRTYFTNLSELKELALGIFMGGLAYAPFCLWESRMSPQLHIQIYGPWIDFLDFAQAIRLGGYRPTVFMGHGLPVGMWMASATVVGLWLWQYKVVKELFKQPLHLLVIGQVITFALVRSTGAYIYAVASTGILLTARWFRTALPMFLLILGVAGYIWQGATGEYYERPDVKKTIALSYEPGGAEKIGERAGSYWYRVRNEKVLSERARQRLFTGWGGSGGNRAIDPNTGKDATTDSIWILIYGIYGAPGLISFTLLFLLPGVVFAVRYPASMWKHPKVAPASALPIILIIYMWDSTLNAFPNPVYFMTSGALMAMLSEPPERLDTPKRTIVATQPQTITVAATRIIAHELPAIQLPNEQHSGE